MVGNDQSKRYIVTVSSGAEDMEKSYPYIRGHRGKTVATGKRRAIPSHRHDEGVRSRSEAELPPPLLTVQDLAVPLATSSSGIYSRVAPGQVPGALRIGHSLRFDPRVIAQWLSANKASAGGLP